MTKTELQKKIARLEAELAVAMKKRADGGGVFKPEYEQKYWYISREGKAENYWWEDHSFDHDRYAIGNCFPTKQEAEDAVRVLKLIQKARKSQDGFVSDWENLEQIKYALYFEKGEVCITKYISPNLAPILGFWEDESVCEQFIHENREELLWFFCEYRL